MFWGSLTYQALDQSRTQVTFNGKGAGFDLSFGGKWLEPLRMHRGATQFPDRGRNYFPGAITVVYSRVVEVLDPNNFIVDFAYTSGTLPIQNQAQIKMGFSFLTISLQSNPGQIPSVKNRF